MEYEKIASDTAFGSYRLTSKSVVLPAALFLLKNEILSFG